MNVSPVPGPGLPANATLLLKLTGHTTGIADSKGLIVVSGFGIEAVPWDYNAAFTLTDFPSVCPLASCTCGSVCATNFGPFHEPSFMHMHVCLLIESHIAGSLNCCHVPSWL